MAEIQTMRLGFYHGVIVMQQLRDLLVTIMIARKIYLVEETYLFCVVQAGILLRSSCTSARCKPVGAISGVDV